MDFPMRIKIAHHIFRGYFYLSVLSPTLVIEDPFDSSVNIGKSVFAMHRVKAAFNYALSALLSPSPTVTRSTEWII